MDDKSGESMAENEETVIGREVQSCRREAGRLFQIHSAACRKERSAVIRNEGDLGARARVIKGEKRVPRGG